MHWCEPPGARAVLGDHEARAHLRDLEAARHVPERPGHRAGHAGRSPSASRAARRAPSTSMQTIITMDPPKHREYRKVASPWFTPHALARLDEVVQASARRLVDRLYDAQTNGEGRCDFVTEIAVQHPLRILCTILGVPRGGRGSTSCASRSSSSPARIPSSSAPRRTARRRCKQPRHRVPAVLRQDHRRPPRERRATTSRASSPTPRSTARRWATIETLGYYLIVFTAGHDTTRNAIAGGMLALLENPDAAREAARATRRAASPTRSRRSCAGRRRSTT